MDKSIIFLLIILATILISCTTEIKDINYFSDDLIGKNLAVRGKIIEEIEVGGINGYTIQDDTGSISVRTTKKYKVGSTVTVNGKVQKSPLGSYYIDTRSLRERTRDNRVGLPIYTTDINQ